MFRSNASPCQICLDCRVIDRGQRNESIDVGFFGGRACHDPVGDMKPVGLIEVAFTGHVRVNIALCLFGIAAIIF
jgi:hypothetical protein